MSNLAPAVAFGVKVIELLASQTAPVGISEISRQTGINKNMVSRILHTLEAEDWVSCDEHSCYRLTLLPFCLTSKVVSRFSLSNVGVPCLQKFWKEFGESSYLGVLHGDEVLYLAHFDSTQKIRVAGAVGGSYPLYCTAPGKALLAYGGEDFIEQYLATHALTPYTNSTIVEAEALKAELSAIRACGYSIDNEEFGYGIVCMAAPIFDHTQAVVGVIGCSVSTVYCKADAIYAHCGESLLETAAQISKHLGCVN